MNTSLIALHRNAYCISFIEKNRLLKKACQLILLLVIFCPQLLEAQTISFSKTSLIGTSLSEPTSLDFGPDGRLYVSVRKGTIYAYTINKVGNNYQVVATETITLVKNIPNHNDDGSPNSSNERQVTGILVVGTPQNPIIYASSSDERIGGGGGSDTNLDTNSGVVSRLTFNGTNWEKVDLVRGLPRSEENHATNGIQYAPATNKLYVAQGGNTNAGAPSSNFDNLCEYALSTSILEIDLDMLDGMPELTDATSGQKYIYDLPTIDDPTRTNDASGNDINDPFGGNDGLNQAKYVPGGPIYIYSRGYRNHYDLVITELGNMYTIDNGANGGIGGHPENEGTANVTNNYVIGEPGSNTPGPNDDKVNNKDNLHKVTENYYAGHPNPVRANPLGAGLFTHEDGPSTTGTFRTMVTGNLATTLPVDWPPYPESIKDLREADFQNPGVSDASIYTWDASTNGMDEYTATTFGGAMKGDLLAVSFSGDLYRIDLDANGDIGPEGVTSIANQFGIPLDVTALPNNMPFAGTIWVAEYSDNIISILEPENSNTCLGTFDNTIDEDGDGYTNADEIENGSDPCNPSINPPDFDQTLIGGFKVSNLNDPDDDDDGLLDTVDPFAQDAYNGLNTSIPIFNKLANGTGGLLDLGFTGLMSNGNTDYLDLIANENDIIAGGAPELLVIPNVGPQIALGNSNNEFNAFQFGVAIDASTPAFTVSGKIVPPFLSNPPTNNQQLGIYIGTGDQNNYIKIVLHANNGVGGVQVIQENNGQPTIQNYTIPTILSAASNELSLAVEPINGTVQPQVTVGGGTPIVLGGNPLTATGSLLNAIQNSGVGLAIGITASSINSGTPFTAIWDDISLLFDDPNMQTGQWETINDGSNCSALGSPGSCPTGRHENAYLEAGNKFYLIGGRETTKLNIYDPITDIWTEGANAPVLLHHFQAVAYKGLIYVLGAFGDNNFPNEVPVPNIYIYDPVQNAWTVGPEIPVGRRRGSAATVVYQDKIYLSGGIQDGHNSGRVAWLDEFDPKNNTWTSLTDAPNVRDHCHAVVRENKLYMIGGKKSNLGGNLNATEPDVDVYDFANNSWQTLLSPLPTERGGNSLAILGNEILVIGGESNSGSGLNKTEAYNVDDNTWRTLANLNQGRHGTQAIVNNGVIYLASGSPNIGGGNLQSQEIFYFQQNNSPVLTPIAASTLVPQGTNLDNTNTLHFVNNTEQIALNNTNGNQGILINDISFGNGTDPSFSYSLTNNANLPILIAPGESLSVDLSTTNPNPASVDGNLIIIHSGSNAPTSSIVLNNPICTDSDNDGFCLAEDCDDNDPTVPTIPGTTCDDSNPNTSDDVILADGCTCAGSGGGIADCNGVLFLGGNGSITVDNLLGTSEKVEIIGAGTNYNTIVICDGDCNDTQVIPNLTPGEYDVQLNMFGVDNSYCYRKETVTVLSGPCTDVDNDGVCAASDCNDNDPAVPTIPGTSCDDGDNTTTNDVYLADGCTCQGTVSCATDADNDGVCATEDCDDNDPAIPTAPGTSCDDGDINTVGDVIQPDGCTCAGSTGGPANCDAITFAGGQGSITISNLTAASENIQLIGVPTNWQIVEVCDGNCGDQQIITNLVAGIYTVKINMFGDDNSYCYREEEVTVLSGPCTDIDNDGICADIDCDDTDPLLPATPGTSCDDGDNTTTNDVYLADGCTCQGTVTCVTDADNDGVCATEDCDDNDPAIPTTPGTSCDDGDINTVGDVIQSDGCTCAGSMGGPANCDAITFIGGPGIMTISNLTAASESIQLIGAPTNWQIIDVCDGNCGDQQIITNLVAGTYAVKINMFGDDNSYCYREEDITVLPGSCIDVDNDGVCSDTDCDDNNPLLPATPGTSCDDGDNTTTNDVYLADGCTCQGTVTCATDADNDGVCAIVDCDDNDPTIPTVPGTSCDDGDINTVGDVIQSDGCTCQGTMGGPANCDAIQFNGGTGSMTITNLTAASESIQYLGAGTNWQTVEVCSGNCEDQQIITNLDGGSYTVKINMFGNDNSYCYRQEEVTVLPVSAGFSECTDTDLILKNNPASGFYQASNTVQSEGTCEVLTFATFKAGSSITLKEGFYARNGASFTATIAPCIHNSQSTEPREQSFKIHPKTDLFPDILIQPNPFQEVTNILYYLPEASLVQLSIYNQFGQLITTPIKQAEQARGNHSLILDGRSLKTGIYYVNLIWNGKNYTKKVLVIK